MRTKFHETSIGLMLTPVCYHYKWRWARSMWPCSNEQNEVSCENASWSLYSLSPGHSFVVHWRMQQLVHRALSSFWLWTLKSEQSKQLSLKLFLNSIASEMVRKMFYYIQMTTPTSRFLIRHIDNIKTSTEIPVGSVLGGSRKIEKRKMKTMIMFSFKGVNHEFCIENEIINKFKME